MQENILFVRVVKIAFRLVKDKTPITILQKREADNLQE